jgi:hypothetical protein
MGKSKKRKVKVKKQLYFQCDGKAHTKLNCRIRIRIETNADLKHWLNSDRASFDEHSVTDPGCLSRIRIFSIPDPHQKILIRKIVSKLSEI